MKRMVTEIQDDDFLYKIKEKVFHERKSVKDYVIGLIEADLVKEEKNAGSSKGE